MSSVDNTISEQENSGANHTANDYPIFLGSEIEQPQREQALFHVLPIPLEKSVSYGAGTALGPAAIVEASWQLETWDEISNPSLRGIFTHPPINVDQAVEQVIADTATCVEKIASTGGLTVGIGGEHTVTYGIVKGLIQAGHRDFGVVQIDAHADLRDAYEGDPYSHASVMKRVVDLGIPLLQLGVRAFCEEERDCRTQHRVLHHDASVLVPNNISAIELPDDFPPNVFFTLDVDGMDPSVFPSTGTPVPGGLGWYQTLALFESIVKQRNIIGFDVTEFSPIPGFHAYEFSAALLIYKMMGIIERDRYPANM